LGDGGSFPAIETRRRDRVDFGFAENLRSIAQGCYRRGMAHLRLTIVLESGARIGSGKAALLESVHSTGSISAAARSMGMDYKRAWLLIDSLNRAFVTPAIERSTGGAGGGGAVLTPFGKDLLERYRRLEAAASSLAKADLKALERKAASETGPKV
jgi:molybdate transport system regulatory protein